VVEAPPPEDLQAREDAVAAPAANLELLAGDHGRRAGVGWLRQLYFADACRSVYASRPTDDDLHAWLSSLEKASQMRAIYITVARAELATERAPLLVVDIHDGEAEAEDPDADA
jgi:hypothetical protein